MKSMMTNIMKMRNGDTLNRGIYYKQQKDISAVLCITLNSEKNQIIRKTEMKLVKISGQKKQ